MLAIVSADLPWFIGLIEGIFIGMGWSIAVLATVLVVQWARGR